MGFNNPNNGNDPQNNTNQQNEEPKDIKIPPQQELSINAMILTMFQMMITLIMEQQKTINMMIRKTAIAETEEPSGASIAGLDLNAVIPLINKWLESRKGV